MTGPIPTEAEEVVDFWLQAGTAAWFRHDPRFDTRFRNRYLECHEQAAGGQLDAWANSPPGALALLILLDQFPRNAFRQSARMFATDAKARAIADRAIKDGLDGSVSDDLRSFFYLPFEHSEDAADQARSLALFEPMGGEVLKFAKLHADIIERFGRFPHRNTVLGRVSTPEHCVSAIRRVRRLSVRPRSAVVPAKSSSFPSAASRTPAPRSGAPFRG